MKPIQRTLALLLALLMLAAACSTALATNYSVSPLKTGKWYKLVYGGDLNTIYKLTLSTDSAVTISWKGNGERESWGHICRDKACEDTAFFFLSSESKASGSVTVALSKGTYYVRMFDGAEKPATQVKFTARKATFKANYCRAKAAVLKARQTEKICQTADHCYDRWFKITVPKKKTVTIATNEGQGEYVTLYDAKMKEVECTSGNRTVVTEDKLAKGTYFIRVGYYDYQISERAGQYITLKWY